MLLITTLGLSHEITRLLLSQSMFGLLAVAIPKTLLTGLGPTKRQRFSEASK
jgi:hypothetical protein